MEKSEQIIIVLRAIHYFVQSVGSIIAVQYNGI